jgi:Flp pilus assembly protein TadG
MFIRRAQAGGLAEFAVTSLLFLSLVIVATDLALWFTAQNVVIGASQHAAAVASRGDGTVEAAEKAAWDFVRSGLGAWTGTRIDRVRVEIDGDSAMVEVHGSWPVSPLGAVVSMPLHATTTTMRERFRPGGR